MFTKLQILSEPIKTVTSYLLLGLLVALLSGCPSASNPGKPSSSSSSSSSSQTSSPGATGSTPRSQDGGAGSTGASLPPASDSGINNGFEEPWADIGDHSDASYEDTGTDSDTGIGPKGEIGFEQEPNFSEAEPGSANGKTDVFSENTQQPGTEGSYPEKATAGARPVLTDREQVAVFDGQLNKGTAKFDDMILKEREAIRRSASGAFPESEDIDGDGDGDGDGGYPGSIYDSGNSEHNGDASASASGPQVPAREGDYGQTVATYPKPADIPDGSDDDVVARQLKEAAMREPDPVLREKLWEEYRKYKGIK